jgi:hypothetical protein
MSYPMPGMFGSVSHFVSVSTPPVPSLSNRFVSQSIVPAVPILCRDPAHAVLVAPPPVVVPPPAPIPTGPTMPSKFYLSYRNSPFVNPPALSQISANIDPAGDGRVYLSLNVWQVISDLFDAIRPAPPALVVADSPRMTKQLTGDNRIFLLFGIRENFTFSVPSHFAIEFLERGPFGIRQKLYDHDAVSVISTHTNHQYASVFRISFIRDED